MARIIEIPNLLISLRKQSDRIAIVGTWVFVHRDRYGNIKDYEVVHNIVPNEGLNYLLGAALHGDSQINQWYFAPHITSGFTPLATHTYASPGYTEATTQILESKRQEWVEGAASSQQITNDVAAVVTATGSVTFYGAGLVGGGSAPDTKGDTAGGGILLASSVLASPKTLDTDETLSMTYTISASSS